MYSCHVWSNHFLYWAGQLFHATSILSEAWSCGTIILVQSFWSLTYRPITCDEQVLSLQIPSSLLQLGCHYTVEGGREISWSERKPGWCCSVLCCVCVSTEESFIFLVLRVAWPKLVLIFIFHCFSSVGICYIYINIIKLFWVWSFWMVSSRKSITAGCVMYICIYKNSHWA